MEGMIHLICGPAFFAGHHRRPNASPFVPGTGPASQSTGNVSSSQMRAGQEHRMAAADARSTSAGVLARLKAVATDSMAEAEGSRAARRSSNSLPTRL